MGLSHEKHFTAVFLVIDIFTLKIIELNKTKAGVRSFLFLTIIFILRYSDIQTII